MAPTDDETEAQAQRVQAQEAQDQEATPAGTSQASHREEVSDSFVCGGVQNTQGEAKSESESSTESGRVEAIEILLIEQLNDLKRDYSSGSIMLAEDRHMLVRAKRTRPSVFLMLHHLNVLLSVHLGIPLDDTRPVRAALHKGGFRVRLQRHFRLRPKPGCRRYARHLHLLLVSLDLQSAHPFIHFAQICEGLFPRYARSLPGGTPLTSNSASKPSSPTQAGERSLPCSAGGLVRF